MSNFASQPQHNINQMSQQAQQPQFNHSNLIDKSSFDPRFNPLGQLQYPNPNNVSISPFYSQLPPPSVLSTAVAAVGQDKTKKTSVKKPKFCPFLESDWQKLQVTYPDLKDREDLRSKFVSDGKVDCVVNKKNKKIPIDRSSIIQLLTNNL